MLGLVCLSASLLSYLTLLVSGSPPFTTAMTGLEQHNPCALAANASVLDALKCVPSTSVYDAPGSLTCASSGASDFFGDYLTTVDACTAARAYVPITCRAYACFLLWLGMAFADFVQHPHSRIARLQEPHVLALRLYTTAAFRSLNVPLRDTRAERPPHPFPITVNYIREGISQLRAAAQQHYNDDTLDLWRGLKNLKAGAEFQRHGGTELAPMSRPPLTSRSPWPTRSRPGHFCSSCARTASWVEART